MTNRRTATALIGALTVALLLTFGMTAYSNSELHSTEVRTLEQSRQYTDQRIIETQANMLAAISDVSKTTTLLTRILCRTEFDKNECEQQLGPLYKEN